MQKSAYKNWPIAKTNSHPDNYRELKKRDHQTEQRKNHGESKQPKTACHNQNPHSERIAFPCFCAKIIPNATYHAIHFLDYSIPIISISTGFSFFVFAKSGLPFIPDRINENSQLP